MGDERRNDGSGAVVAIVLVLGILLLVGVVVVLGAGAFFFVAHDMPAPPQPVMIAPTPTLVAPPAPVAADLEPATSLEEVAPAPVAPAAPKE